MTALRELRRAADLSQQQFAALIDVPLNTFRMWDSGLRPIPPPVLRHAQTAATAHLRNAERLSLDQLAREFGVHERTLRAAARTGRLLVTFTSRSAFGRPRTFSASQDIYGDSDYSMAEVQKHSNVPSHSTSRRRVCLAKSCSLLSRTRRTSPVPPDAEGSKDFKQVRDQIREE
jgi:DNA-binding transcriptional regulator YiaG